MDDTLVISDSLVGSKGHKLSLKDDGVTECTPSKQETMNISISDATALRLAKIGLHLESLFGSARDVEWAIVGERIFLLQARPITTINTWTDFELMHELDSEVPPEVDLITFANVGEVLPRPISPLSSSTIIKVLNLVIGAKFNFDCTYLHLINMRCAMNYYNVSICTYAFICIYRMSKPIDNCCCPFFLLKSALQDVDQEITIANKMVDIAICGRVVTTSEIHRLAIKKYGIVSGWRKMYLLYDMFKAGWMSDAIVRAATDMSNKFILNANEFDTPRNLYNVINKKYKEIYLVSYRIKKNIKFNCENIYASVIIKCHYFR